MFRQNDSAVSPVIAVILMVAITVVLAATVYVWVSGFQDQGGQPPSAAWKVLDCDPSSETVTLQMISGSNIQSDDLALFVTTDDGGNVGISDPMQDANGSGIPWQTGKTVKVGVDVVWSDQPDLNSGSVYRLDITHKPTNAVISSLRTTC